MPSNSPVRLSLVQCIPLLANLDHHFLIDINKVIWITKGQVPLLPYILPMVGVSRGEWPLWGIFFSLSRFLS